jgi:hypothetical protein
MIETEQKALALVNEVSTNKLRNLAWCPPLATKALCRAIEQHEAFKQEVSDVLEEVCDLEQWPLHPKLWRFLPPKSDPLVEIIKDVLASPGALTDEQIAQHVRDGLSKRGLKIVENDSMTISESIKLVTATIVGPIRMEAVEVGGKVTFSMVYDNDLMAHMGEDAAKFFCDFVRRTLALKNEEAPND